MSTFNVQILQNIQAVPYLPGFKKSGFCVKKSTPLMGVKCFASRGTLEEFPKSFKFVKYRLIWVNTESYGGPPNTLPPSQRRLQIHEIPRTVRCFNPLLLANFLIVKVTRNLVLDDILQSLDTDDLVLILCHQIYRCCQSSGNARFSRCSTQRFVVA